MRQAGWYPDPSGVPGQLRWWDGRQWTSAVQGGALQASPKRQSPWLLVVALVVFVALLAWFIRGNSGGDSIPEDTNSSRPTISGWDETSTPTPTPTPTPSETEPSGAREGKCPLGRDDDTYRSSDGTIRGGGLVASVPDGFQFDATPNWGYSFNQKEGADRGHPEGGKGSTRWQSTALVGRISRPAFRDPRTAARLLVQCHVTSGNFSGYISKELVYEKAVSIGGKPGWQRQERVSTSTAPRGVVVYTATVVDLGDDEWLSAHWVGKVLGDPRGERALDAHLSTLRLG